MQASVAPLVLVVGAGPVGLTMAAELARYGVAVRIIDKAASRTDKSKALVLWSRTLELLARAGCAQDFVEAGLRATGANFFAGGRRIAHVDLSRIGGEYAYGLMLPQSETERLLEAHLQTLGARVERGVELLAFSQGDTGVTATLRHADGTEETVRADWLVGCDGAHSTVRHGLGLNFAGETLQSDWMLADVHLAGAAIPPRELAMFLHKDGVLAVFPISPGRYRIIANTGAAQGPRPADPTLAAVQGVMDARGPGGVKLSDPIWLSAFRINERKVRDYRLGRAFLAGDAAHVHSPAGGQGMNTGMQDAFNLAWKLALVCHDTCRAEKLLASYSAERGAVGARVLADAGRLTALAVLKNPAARAARNLAAAVLLALPAVQTAMANQLAELSIGYADSPLNGRSARGVRPQAGQRAAPAAGAPVGGGDRPRFVLFGLPEAAAAPLSQRFTDLLEPAMRPPLRPGFVHLLRPDGYVALATRQGGPDAVAGYLESLRV